MQAICLESEDTVHDALEHLPQSLPSIFHRVLDRSRSRGIRRQLPILKTLVAAFRPLTLSEFREAFRTILNTAETAHLDQATDWRRRPKDIPHILSSCGSLVAIDESDLTIHLVHPSVRQFLLGEMNDTESYREWQFSLHDAHKHLAEVSILHLSSWSERNALATTPRDSKATPSPRVVLPNPAAITQVAQARQGKIAKLVLITRATKAKMTAGAATIERMWPGTLPETSSPDLPEHAQGLEFFVYAKKYWMHHSASISESDGKIYQLWMQVLNDSETTDWLNQYIGQTRFL